MAKLINLSQIKGGVALQADVDLLKGLATEEGSVAYAVAQEEAARKAQIGELGKQALPADAPEGTEAVDHTVKSYVDAKVSAANGETGALADLVGTAEDTKDDATVFGAIAAEADRAATKEGELQDAIDTLNGDEETEGSVAKAVKDAVDALDGEVDTRVAKLEALHATKEVTTGEGEDAVTTTVMQTVAEEVATGIANLRDGADEAFDTLKEIAEWIQSPEGGQAFDAANRIVALETATAGLVVEEGAAVTVANAIAKAVADASSENGALAEFVGDLPEDTEAETVVGYVDEQVAAEATRIDGIVGTPDEGKTIQGEIDDVEAAIDTLNGDEETEGSVAKAVKDGIDALEADFTGENAVSDADGFVTVELKEEAGVVTTLTVATDDIASADALAKLQAVVGQTELATGEDAGQAAKTLVTRIAANEATLAVLAGDGESSIQDLIDTAVGEIEVEDGEDANVANAIAKAKADGVADAAEYTDELAKAIAPVYDSIAVTGETATTVFTLSATPNANDVVAYINHLAYFQDEDFTVEGKVVTWTATAANGGFDINADLTDEVTFKYYTYVIPAEEVEQP